MFRMYDQYSSEINFSSLEDPGPTWELLDLIGEGTYGEVYSAKHRNTGELAAVKILESIHEIIEEIEAEYKVLRDLGNHGNMPKFHGLYLKTGDTGADDQLWMVMELCSRGSVTDLAKCLINNGEKIGEVLLAHILKETIQVLVYLHKNHLVHRDIKGHNILITADGDIKLIDFGVSGHLKSTFDKKKTSVGTPFWMAPEVIACERQLDYTYDIRCDIWSLGITAIELMDGEPPLADKHPMRALFKIPRNPPPTQRNPSDWSATCKDFLSRCLSKDYQQRPLAWDLLNHPFIKQVPDDTTKLKEQLVTLTSYTDRVLHAPDVTTKQGRLKSRKSRQGPLPTHEDLTKLEVLDEESIVAQLYMRYTQGIIYTYIGDILLAVNPFTPLNIYSEENSRLYMNAAKADHPPHIYAIADQAYQMLLHQKKHQCIVISGESGAGKTESANFLVQQLTQLGKAPNRNLEERILQVNPLMEAFGNAQTVINGNSSRFGKYLEMFFTNSGTVTGAKITEYLLEKSRVIFQARGEQNFHIFYYVHDGLPTEDRSKYHLQEGTVYRYISEYNTSPADISTISVNRVKFKAIQHCFEIIGFKPEEVRSILGVIAAILHAGNLEFQDRATTSHAGEAVEVKNLELTVIVAKLLGLDSKDLVDVLVTTGMVARGEVIIRENTMAEAIDVRDAMSKSLYGRLFSWIVNKINILLQPDKTAYNEQSLRIIGLLDIFGFENFPSNSFEQLCINIANEQIQYYFNQHIFAWELQEYRNEGVDGSVITFVDNRPLLDMFLTKPMGLLSLLDEESHFPKATDGTLVEKFHQNIKNPNYIRPKATSSLNFSVDHFAGRVRYDAQGFLEKNRDRLPAEVVNLLRASSNTVVRSLFQTPLTKTGNLAGGTLKASSASSFASPSSTTTGFSIASVQSLRSQGSSMGGSRGSSSATSMTRIQQTVATYFRFSLMDLLSKMVAGSPHFVRCVRPNEENLPDMFDSKKVKVQLTYTGVLETTRIRREGYSHRILFADFVNRYSLLALGEATGFSRDKAGSQRLLVRLGLTDWALGNTKVFLKFYHMELLSRKFEELHHKVVRIQAAIRMVIARNRFYTRKWALEKAVLVFQKVTRGWRVRRQYGTVFSQRRTAAVTIQTAYRGYITRKHVRPRLQQRQAAAVKLQSAARRYLAKIQVQKLREEQNTSAKLIQRLYRSRQARLLAKQKGDTATRSEAAAVIIQSNYRMWHCRRVYRELQKFKEQKDLQLIYFSQQVKAYSDDLRNKHAGTVHPAKPVPIPVITKTVPSTSQDEPSPPKKKRRAPQAPVAKQKAVTMAKPDIGDERLEHMKRMREMKTVMPLREFDYYSTMIQQETGSVTGGKENGEASEPEQSGRGSKKVLMDEESETYYSTVVKRSSAYMDTDDDQIPLGESAATMSMHRQVSDWDRPLLEAKERVLKSSAVGTPGSATLSPTMQISPYNALSNISNEGSIIDEPSDLHIQFTNRNHSSAISDQSPLVSRKLTPLLEHSHDNQFFPQSMTFDLDPNFPSVPVDEVDTGDVHMMDLGSESETSVTSHELALSMLDRAIDGTLSPRLGGVSPDQDPKVRERLARTVAEAILANSSTASGPTPVSTSAPVLQRVDIVEDLKTDREEFFSESSKDDLIATLKEEYSKSAHGKWQMLQRLVASGKFLQTQVSSDSQPGAAVPNSVNHRQRQPDSPVGSKKTVIPVTYGAWKQSHQNNRKVPERTRSKVKFSAGKPAVIDVRLNNNNNNTTNMNHHAPVSPTYPFVSRAMLKPTKIVPEHSLSVQQDSNNDKPIYDFRKLLRKTGRLDVIASEQ